MKSIKFLLLLLVMAVITTVANAQTIKGSIFKPLPKPKEAYSVPLGASLNKDLTAWRITPAAGYNFTTKQLMAGLGYGIQWTHFVDSTQKYYTDFSISAVGWVNGNTTPSLNPPNFISYGIMFGLKNQLFNVGAAYTPKTSLTKSSIGLIVNIGVGTNN